jgi:hypothetical protein
MTFEINIGSKVQFDSGYGMQRGTVLILQRDINNGQGFAVVRFDSGLPGCTCTVPLNELQLEAKAA